MEEKNWFSEAKYGLFIHWGIYSVLEGVYEGKEIPYGAEWIMKNAGIPLAEYREMTKQFKPSYFDAEKLVKMAKQWGMKYLVFTAKHHDGFCMFDSKISDYTIINTPFGRDVVRELASACRKEEIVFCLYYSQMQDWAEENGWGNTWDFKKDEEKDFELYFRQKVKPQVEELLTQYGDVKMIWFDTPYTMPKKLCMELREWVKKCKGDCLINGRIGYNLGDFKEIPDNEIPLLSYPHSWETPMTLNHTWGYSRVDENWKTPEVVVRKLVRIVGKGGNLLLNIGPDPRGEIPKGSASVLEQVGKWLEKNGESIYGTEPVKDFPYELRFGGITKRGNILYLHVWEYPRFPYEILLVGLLTRVKNVTLLVTGEKLTFYQSYEIARDEHRFRVLLPEKIPDAVDTVVKVELDSEMQVYDMYQ